MSWQKRRKTDICVIFVSAQKWTRKRSSEAGQIAQRAHVSPNRDAKHIEGLRRKTELKSSVFTLTECGNLEWTGEIPSHSEVASLKNYRCQSGPSFVFHGGVILLWLCTTQAALPPPQSYSVWRYQMESNTRNILCSGILQLLLEPTPSESANFISLVACVETLTAYPMFITWASSIVDVVLIRVVKTLPNKFFSINIIPGNVCSIRISPYTGSTRHISISWNTTASSICRLFEYFF